MKTLGYGPNVTLLLTAPPYLFALIVQVINSWHSGHTQERYFHATWPAVLGIIAYIIAVTNLNNGARYTAFMFMVASETGLGITWAWVSGTLMRPPEKRAAALAALNALNSAFSIWVPYTYLDSQAPRYEVAFVVDIILCTISIMSATVLRIRLRRPE